MGSALRLHPLLVIFGLLAGGEIYGLPGALIALPLLAAGRAAWEFFAERLVLEPWREGGVVPVEVEPARLPPAGPGAEAATVERPPPRRPFAPVPRSESPPSEPPAAARR